MSRPDGSASGWRDFSTSSLWSSTSVLYVWVRRSISILSLTRPFHNCAIRVAAIRSSCRRHGAGGSRNRSH